MAQEERTCIEPSTDEQCAVCKAEVRHWRQEGACPGPMIGKRKFGLFHVRTEGMLNILMPGPVRRAPKHEQAAGQQEHQQQPPLADAAVAPEYVALEQ